MLANIILSPDSYLPLNRFVESASSVRETPGVSDWLNWAPNVFLAAAGWLWSFYQWIAGLSPRIFAENTEDLTRQLSDAGQTLTDEARIVAATVIAGFWLYGVMHPGRSVWQATKTLLVSMMLFTAAIALTSTIAVESFVRNGRAIVGEVAEVPLSLAEDSVAHSLQTDTRSEWAPENDYLSCSAYYDYLLHRSSQSEDNALPRIVNAWMMWSFLPYWEKANYGNDAGHTASRVACRELEMGAGTSAAEQSHLALCAAGYAKLRHDEGSVDGFTNDQMCATGRAHYGVGNKLGPFADHHVTSSTVDATRAASAWAICVAKNDPQTSGSGGWFIHPGFAPLEITAPAPFPGGEAYTTTLKELYQQYGVCDAWFRKTGNRQFLLSTCPPWDQACDAEVSAKTDALRNPTIVPPASYVLDTYPQRYPNWGDPLADLAYAEISSVKGNVSPEAGEQAVTEMEAWVEGRGSGGPGNAEAFVLFIALLGSLAYLPVSVGVVLGYLGSSLLLSLIAGLAPAIFMIAAIPPFRKVGITAARWCVFAIIGWIAAVVALSVFTGLIGWLAELGPAETGRGDLLRLAWAAAAPFLVWKGAQIAFRYIPASSRTQQGVSAFSSSGMMMISGSTQQRQETLQPYGEKALNPVASTAKSSGSRIRRSYQHTKQSMDRQQRRAIASAPGLRTLDFQAGKSMGGEEMLERARQQTAEDYQVDLGDEPSSLRYQAKKRRHEREMQGTDLSRAVDKAHPSNIRSKAEAKARVPEDLRRGRTSYLKAAQETRRMGDVYAKAMQAYGRHTGGEGGERLKKAAVQAGQQYYSQMLRALALKIHLNKGKVSAGDIETSQSHEQGHTTDGYIKEVVMRLRPYDTAGRVRTPGVANFSQSQAEADMLARDAVYAPVRHKLERLLKTADRMVQDKRNKFGYKREQPESERLIRVLASGILHQRALVNWQKSGRTAKPGDRPASGQRRQGNS